MKCKILGFGIRNLSSTDKESVIQYQESGIHNLESRIQDCLDYFSIGRFSHPPQPVIYMYRYLNNCLVPYLMELFQFKKV